MTDDVFDALTAALVSDEDFRVRGAAAEALLHITLKSAEDTLPDIMSRLRRAAEAEGEVKTLLSQLTEIADARELSARAKCERDQDFGDHPLSPEQHELLESLYQEQVLSDASVRELRAQREKWQNTRSRLTLQKAEELDVEVTRLFMDMGFVSNDAEELQAQRLLDLVSQGGSHVETLGSYAYETAGFGEFILKTFIPNPDSQYAAINWRILREIGLMDSRWVTGTSGDGTSRLTILEAVFASLAYGRHSWHGASGEGDEHIYRLLELAFAVEGLSHTFCYEMECFVARFRKPHPDIKPYSGPMARRALRFCFWKHPGSLSALFNSEINFSTGYGDAVRHYLKQGQPYDTENALLGLVAELNSLGVSHLWDSVGCTAKVDVAHRHRGLDAATIHFLRANAQRNFHKRQRATVFEELPVGFKAVFNMDVASSNHFRSRDAIRTLLGLIDVPVPGLLRELVRCHERHALTILIKCAPNLKSLEIVRPLFLFSRSVRGKQQRITALLQMLMCFLVWRGNWAGITAPY